MSLPPPPGAYPLPPQYPPHQQGHAPGRPGSYRWLIPALTGAGGLIAGGFIGFAAAGTSAPSAAPAASPSVAATPGPRGYQDPTVLAHALRSILAKRLANPSGQFYDPGVTVKSVSCVETSKTAATCLWKLSSGQSGTDGIAISADGSRFISK